MSSSRVQVPPVNLKERIAALQQRNASSAQRSISPTPPSATPSTSSAGALREKIARFEKKGGVPVPRGSFGLGAPPPSDGYARKQGQLYGTRIPQPVRVVSGGSVPQETARSHSPSGHRLLGGDKRRSFSLSNVVDYSDIQDNTSLTSPSISSPPESPQTPSDGISEFSPTDVVTASSPLSARSAERTAIRNRSDIPVLDGPNTPEAATPALLVTPPAIIVSMEESAMEQKVVESAEPPQAEQAEDQLPSAIPLSEETCLSSTPQYSEAADIAIDLDIVDPENISTASISAEHDTYEPSIDPSPSVYEINEVEEKAEELLNDRVRGAAQAPSTETEGVDSPSSVPFSHTLILRAAGLGSPSSDENEAPSISETVSSDDEGNMISPVVALASPSALNVQSPQPSQEPELKKALPPALSLEGAMLSLDGFTLPLSPPLLSNALASSHIEAGSASPASESVDLSDVDKVEKEKDTTTRVEAVVTQPPSPSTPHASQSPLSLETPATPVQDPQTPTSPLTPDLDANFSVELSRSISMIECSPSHVQIAHRVTPTTSRGVPVFLPSTSPPATRKSDLVYYPPTPPGQDQHFEVGEQEVEPDQEQEQDFGSVAIHHQRFLSTGETYGSASRKPSFRAVVHDKIREVAPIINHGPFIPETPQVKRLKSTATNNLPPPSPGQGDLAALLQETVLLQRSLERGNLPTEAPATAITEADNGSQETVIRREDGLEIRRLSREEAEENRRTLAKLQAKREEQAKSKLKSTFRNTLARAKSAAVSTTSLHSHFIGSASNLTSQPQPNQQQYARRFKSPSVPHLLDSVDEDGSVCSRPKTPEQRIAEGKPRSVSSKSPRSRFPNFRRLGGSRSSKDGQANGHTRNSVSTSSELSSEDSAPAIVTPPDNALEFGEINNGHMKQGSGGLSWPSLSPSKKGNGSITRAATFAGKVWQRARTRSGASARSIYESPDQMSAEPPPALPPLPQIVLPSSELEDMIIEPPARTTSLKLLQQQSLPPSPPPPPLPPKHDDPLVPSEYSRSSTPQPVRRSQSLTPDTPSSTRRPGDVRMSWVSVSSADSTLPASIIDHELFDAFPSVPQGHPQVMSPSSPLLPSPKRGPQAGTGPSFDSALLSSAAHLVAGQGNRLSVSELGNGMGLGFDVFPPASLVSPYSPPNTASPTVRDIRHFGVPSSR